MDSAEGHKYLIVAIYVSEQRIIWHSASINVNAIFQSQRIINVIVKGSKLCTM